MAGLRKTFLLRTEPVVLFFVDRLLSDGTLQLVHEPDLFLFCLSASAKLYSNWPHSVQPRKETSTRVRSVVVYVFGSVLKRVGCDEERALTRCLRGR